MDTSLGNATEKVNRSVFDYKGDFKLVQRGGAPYIGNPTVAVNVPNFELMFLIESFKNNTFQHSYATMTPKINWKEIKPNVLTSKLEHYKENDLEIQALYTYPGGFSAALMRKEKTIKYCLISDKSMDSLQNCEFSSMPVLKDCTTFMDYLNKRIHIYVLAIGVIILLLLVVALIIYMCCKKGPRTNSATSGNH